MEGAQTAVTPATQPNIANQPGQTNQQSVPNKVETPKPFKTARMNLNGKWVERSWATEADLERDLQKTIGIEEKAQQNAAKIDAAQKLLDYINGKNPEDYKKFVKLCKQNNIDYKKFATDILYDEIELEKMTPEQKKLKEYEEREKDDKFAKEEAERTEKEAKQQRDLQEWTKKFESECIEALKTKQLPSSRLSIALLAQYMDSALAQGHEVAVSSLIPFVQRDLQQLNQQTILSLDGKALLDYLGPEVLKKITQAKITDYKDKDLTPKPATSKSKNNPERNFNWKKEMNRKRVGW